jgi:hypothetical protein
MAGQTGGDYSGGCKWYHTLSGPASLDWGVCAIPVITFLGCTQITQEG